MYSVVFVYTLIFCLGLIVGSFLNVVILRLNTGRSIARGRSQCFACGKTLKWHELLPVVSFVILLGRCSRCGTHILLQYPAVEFVTGALFLALYINRAEALLYVIVALLIVIFVYDLRHKIIPDKLVYPFIIVAFMLRGEDWWAGLLAFTFFAGLWLFSRGRAMGFGDAKLALGMGFLLGTGVLSAFFLSFWLGAIVGITLLLLSRGKLTMKSEIPFAPFMIIGTLIAYFFNPSIF